MKQFLFLIFFVYLTTNLSSQNALRFDNIISSDTVYIFRNDRVKFLYHGYLNQLETVKGKILNINDSLVSVGYSIFGIVFQKKEIKISDIYGFKKYTVFRRISYGVVLVSLVGISVLLPQMLNIDSIISAYAVSFGAGISGSLITSLIFNDVVKNTRKNGWQLIILYPKV